MTHTEARALASQFGTRMCDENGDTHGEELYCFDLDDIIALKETLAQPEQEPVAWLSTDSIGERHLCFDKPLDNDPVQPLFTSPPQRTWVGLTEQDLDYLCNLAYTGDEEFALAVQAKLMEKNA